MTAWWNTLAPRERAMLVGCALALLVFVAWLALWRPVAAAQQSAAVQAEALRADMPYLTAAAAEVQRLKALGGTQASRGGQSLLALAESSARGAGLGDAWRRAEPGAANELRVWLQNASFDPMLRWLDLLQRRYGITVAEANIDRAGVPGLVNARLVLSEPAAP